jgi:hypothetical protein
MSYLFSAPSQFQVGSFFWRLLLYFLLKIFFIWLSTIGPIVCPFWKFWVPTWDCAVDKLTLASWQVLAVEHLESDTQSCYFLWDFCFIPPPLIVVLGGGTLWHLQRFLQCINYVILEFISSTTPLYLPLPWFMKQFQQVSFLHLHACEHIFCMVFTLLTPFPTT